MPDARRQGSVAHSMSDAPGAAFAMFHPKFGSMLEFDTLVVCLAETVGLSEPGSLEDKAFVP